MLCVFAFARKQCATEQAHQHMLLLSLAHRALKRVREVQYLNGLLFVNL